MPELNKSAILMRAKQSLKQIPAIYKVYGFVAGFISTKNQINEISDLIKENKMVVFNPYFNMPRDKDLTRTIVHDVVKDFLHVYGSVRLGKSTIDLQNVPGDSALFKYPLALIRIPPTHEEYLKRVGDKTRNMIRKAEKHGYEFGEFVWDDHLDEIFEINLSKDVRQSEPMRGWYTKPVQPRHHTPEELKYRKYYGAFKDGKLVAYLHIVECGDFAFFRHFLGHAQHLKYGIMNGLIFWTVRQYVGCSHIKWLKYGTLSKLTHSMNSFRKHAGFEGYAVFLNCENDAELLAYSKEVQVRPWWSV